jgi:hypothetical protein
MFFHVERAPVPNPHQRTRQICRQLWKKYGIV